VVGGSSFTRKTNGGVEIELALPTVISPVIKFEWPGRENPQPR
jgi:hypothetical protein